MQKNVILFLGILFMTVPASLLGQQDGGAALYGSVVSAVTGEPLAGAHVFLAGTTIGTSTNSAGHYHITGVSDGAHRIAISMLGYGRAARDILVDGSASMDFRLRPVVYELEQLIVFDPDERWERHLDRFTRLFLGDSSRADSVFIHNPEVLRFSSSWWGSRLTAEALLPLVIENRALGYRITYYLDEFRHSGGVTRWHGDALFEELEPRDAEQEAAWEEQRKKSFEGSLRHFLLSLSQDRLDEAGFSVYVHPANPGFSPHRSRQRITAERIIRPEPEKQVSLFSFSGRLEVVYSGAGEEEEFIRWQGRWNRARASSQTSFLELNERPLNIDPDGEILETYGATRFGYFSFRRIAEKTPREYRPPETQ